MEASIKANRITDFVRLLQCASKFGDDLNISANKDLWELAVTNSSKSAFCLFRLHRAFFCRYKTIGTSVEQRRGVKCQLLVKSLLAVLGKTSAAGNVERVDLKIHDPDHSLGGGRRRRRGRRETTESGGATDEDESEDDVGNSIESILVMKLVCKHGVIKRHSLHLAQTEFLRADVDPDTTPSGFLIDARTLRDWLDHFHIGLTSSHVTTSAGTTTIRQENQLSWLFSRDEVRVKSWEGGSRELSTEIKVDPGEFVDYEVFNGRVDLTLPMREFRATLALADQLSIRLVVAFSEAGQPITLTSETFDDGDPVPFEIFCAIATTTCDQFASVKTPSDPPSTNGHGNGSDQSRARSRSTTGFLNRAASGSRNGSLNGQPPAGSTSNDNGTNNGDAREAGNAEGDVDRNVRRRTGSERPPSARPRLSMSNTPTRVSTSTTTAQPRPQTQTAHDESNQTSHDPNALFLPGGSQADLDDTASGSQAGPSNTQGRPQPRLTQREIEELSGLVDLNEVMEAMDDEQHEEELEEMRASQQYRPNIEEGEEGEDGDGDEARPPSTSQAQTSPPPITTTSQERRPSQPRVPLGDITLEMDESIFGLDLGAQEGEGEETTEDQGDTMMDQALEGRHDSPEITVEPAPLETEVQDETVEERRDEGAPIAHTEEPEAPAEVDEATEEEGMNQEADEEEDDEADIPATQATQGPTDATHEAELPSQAGSPAQPPLRRANTADVQKKFKELFSD